MKFARLIEGSFEFGKRNLLFKVHAHGDDYAYIKKIHSFCFYLNLHTCFLITAVH